MAKKSREKTRSNSKRPLAMLWFFSGIILVVILVLWQWDNVVTLFESITLVIGNTLGWGLVLIVLGIFALALFVLIKSVPAFLRALRITARAFGIICFLLASWVILGFLNLGGTFGNLLAGNGIFIGILRFLGFLVLGILLIAPVVSFRVVRRFLEWSLQKGRKKPVTSSVPAAPVTAIAPSQPSETEKSGKKVSIAPSPVKPAVQPAQAFSPEDLKQMAADVWKKYGEAPGLVTVDGWKLPPVEILDHSTEVELSPADNAQRAKLIEEALASYGVEAKVVQINPGPTVTQFGLEPGWDRKYREVKERDRDGNIRVRQEEVSRTRVKVERITSLANDLALTLAAPSIRIEAPVPGKGVVGLEVPNTISSIVTLRGVVETTPFQKLLAKTKMVIALGKGAGGEAVAADLTRMPHLLIAGATGSGKTVCLNAIICSLLLHNTPDEVLFLMIDPKRVELTPYNSIPHLAAPVIVETEKAINTLRWLSQEMDRRYKVMASAGVRNIDAYNKNRKGMDRMPYLVLIIDELADLMMTGNSSEVEHNLCRLAQLARATGIHLVVATQRPSVDVITGLIKANFPTRISFAVTSQVDSRTILDTVGAEKLLGKGDMLYMPTDSDKPKRLQGCYVSDPEVERLVYFWSSQGKEQKRPSLNIEEITAALARKEEQGGDALLEEARKLAREHGHISTSFLQRKLRIGYPRAARIMEQLEEEGVDTEDDEGQG